MMRHYIEHFWSITNCECDISSRFKVQVFHLDVLKASNNFDKDESSCIRPMMNRTKRKNAKNNAKAAAMKESASAKKMQSPASKTAKHIDANKAIDEPDETAPINQIPTIVPPKLSRANTFFITRKISKLYSSLTGSKTGLNNIPENESDSINSRPEALPISPATARPKSMQASANPFKFVRSASMAAIPLHRNPPPGGASSEQAANGPSARDEVDAVVKLRRTNGSDLNLTQDGQRKSSTQQFLSSLKRTFSVNAARRKSHNARWSSSLLTLQQIDVMVSYENLSFIDYDKFNTYEEKLLRQVSQPNGQPQPGMNGVRLPVKYSNNGTNQATEYFENYPQVRRRIKKPVVVQTSDTNFDKPKNLYRQSIDDRKLQILNDLNRQSSCIEATASALAGKYRRFSDGFYSKTSMSHLHNGPEGKRAPINRAFSASDIQMLAGTAISNKLKVS